MYPEGLFKLPLCFARRWSNNDRRKIFEVWVVRTNEREKCMYGLFKDADEYYQRKESGSVEI